MLGTEMGNFKTMDDFDFKGKFVLVRVDVNSPVIDKKIQMNDRIKKHAFTLKEISDEGGKVVVLAHQGRPGSKDYFPSLEQHCNFLSDFLDVNYVDDVLGEKSLESIKKMKSGEVLLLKNIRSLKVEFKPSSNNEIVSKLSPLFDYFVNDAFSVMHRKQTSVVSFPANLKSCIGRVVENELNAIKEIKGKKMLYVMGGAKPEDNLVLIKDSSVSKVLSSGIFSLLCLMVEGWKLGKEEDVLSDKKILLPDIRKYISKIETPVDLAFDDGGRREIKLNELPVDKEILDIGRDTIRKYSKDIEDAEAVFFKGPAGMFEKKGFSEGTVGLLNSIADSDCFSMICGGHSSHVLNSFNIEKSNFSHVSIAGGALISVMAGKKLPGLEALRV